MFALSLIEHKLTLPPHLLGLSLEKAVKKELERLFLDKVIPNLGLCISIYDIQDISGGFVVAGEGAPTYEVIFRLVMFRPFVGEILVGKIEKSSADGLHVTLGFFSDIHIPVHCLRQDCKMEESGIWFWEYEGQQLYLDPDEDIRFRVESIKYPPIPIEQAKDAKPFAPMEITGSIVEDGLGLLSWWEGEGEGEGD